MINVCVQCGQYHVDKVIDESGAFAICPSCGHAHPLVRLPMLVVCGPSCTGKSTVCHALTGQLHQVIILEGDILWSDAFAHPEGDYRAFFEAWLRIAKNIGQSGRPVVLFSAGAIPPNLEPCVERRYFADVHYLCLICDEQILTERLLSRPKWRGSGEETFIKDQLQFNRWCKKYQGPHWQLLDTTAEPPAATAQQVSDWICSLVA